MHAYATCHYTNITLAFILFYMLTLANYKDEHLVISIKANPVDL